MRPRKRGQQNARREAKARQIFALFDIDEDGKLSKGKYADYIKAIGSWGQPNARC